MLLFIAVIAFGCALGVAYALNRIIQSYARRARVYKKSNSFSQESESFIPLLTSKSSYKSKSYSSISSNVFTIFVNGSKIELTNPDPSMLLADFIRYEVGLKGTKLGCEEGGCGACTVSLTNSSGEIISVNSCLRLLCLNDGMSITTVEGIGSVSTGLSEEQKRLVENNGTQCGYCTPGWITNMYALRQSTSANGTDMTSKEIQEYFDGNICRCTGYKPILQAFGSFAHENGSNPSSCLSCPSANTTNCDAKCITYKDLEDGCCGDKCESSCDSKRGMKSKPLGRAKDLILVKNYKPKPLMFYNATTGTRWVRPLTIDDLCLAISEYSSESFQLVGGNTSIGVSKYFNDSGPYYSADPVTTYIDINGISTLTATSFDSSTGQLTIGAATSIKSTIALLKQYGKNITSKNWNDVVNHFSLFDVVAHHLSLIANTQVRNAGTWAGNMALFLKYYSFPSDVVLSFTMAQAKLTICSAVDGTTSVISMDDFLQWSYDDYMSSLSFLVSITITESNYNTSMVALEQGNGPYVISESFKICQREHNAHAHVNAAFQYTVVPSNPPVVTAARIVYGGVSQKSFIACNTQTVLANSRVTSHTLSRALVALQKDLQAVGMSDAYGSKEFRESVMQSCLYRSLLRCYRYTSLPTNLQSSVLPWIKPESRGTEVFIPSNNSNDASKKSHVTWAKPSLDPVGKPVRKLEAPIQATGEAVYPSDETASALTAYGAMAFSTQCSTELISIDTSAALALTGVIAVYTAADIPGENSIGKGLYLLNPIGEEIKCIGLPIAVVVATSEAIANEAAALVSATYGPAPESIVTNISDAITQKSFYKIPSHVPGLSYIKRGDPIKALESSENRVSGYISAGGQSHFYMEAQAALAQVVDGDNINIVCGTQNPASYQEFVASNLGVSNSKVIVRSSRSGGKLTVP